MHGKPHSTLSMNSHRQWRSAVLSCVLLIMLTDARAAGTAKAPPLPAADPRAIVDHAAVGRMAALIAARDGLQAFDFTGDLFPAVGDPATVDWFAAATLQQYGFWYERDGRWGGNWWTGAP